MFNLLKNSQGEILNLFFKDPEREYYLREIAKNLGKEPGYFQVAIDNLAKEGILQDERKGNLRFFKLNKGYPLYEEIKKIIAKTLGLEAKLKEMVDGLAGIESAFIFGSIAKNQERGDSDIDLMLIGRVDQDDLIKKINQLEDELKREINYHLYGQEELAKKLKNQDSFLVRIFKEPKIVLKGQPDEFAKSN